MDFPDLKKKLEKDLHDLLQEQRAELRELIFSASENQLKNVSKIRSTKKSIAQILTALNTIKVVK